MGFGPEFFLAEVRSLLERDQIAAARQMAAAGLEKYPEDSSLRRLKEGLYPGEVRRVPLRDGNHTRDFEWLKANSPAYRGSWVALLDGRLVASAPTLRELLEVLRPLHLPQKPLLHRIV